MFFDNPLDFSEKQRRLRCEVDNSSGACRAFYESLVNEVKLERHMTKGETDKDKYSRDKSLEY